MDGVANEEDFEKYGDPVWEDDDDKATYTTRRSGTMLPKKGLPFRRRSRDVVNYSARTKKARRLSNAEMYGLYDVVCIFYCMMFSISIK
jgi:hypothetical protein